MTLLLLPRLSILHARDIWKARDNLTVTELQPLSATAHFRQTYAPVGSSRMTEGALESLRAEMVDAATSCGFPATNRSDGIRWERVAMPLLHTRLAALPLDEAAREEPWIFLGTVLMPHLVRWRWAASAGEAFEERWSGGRRDTFGRMWWRMRLISDAGISVDEKTLKLIGEDDFVQLLERPNLAGQPFLAGEVLRQGILVRLEGGDVSFRDVALALLRTCAIVHVPTLERDEVVAMVAATISRMRASRPGQR